jgi:DNA polymerase V
MFALVDGNNFYASCERVFRPDLNGRPLVVLSNNDGCAIARSNEAKALGIKMGAPWFQIRHLEEEAGLVALSANFALYGDMSDRMMSLVAGLGHKQEIYSIDESFVDLTGIRGDMIRRSRLIRQRVLQWTGIPTCIGIGPTKTLAKLANHIAKTAERKPGVYPDRLNGHGPDGAIAQICHLGLLDEADKRILFERTDVTEVWGVGPRIGKQLKDAGILTVQDLVQLDPVTVARRWSVVLERTVRELQGIACIDLEHQPPAKQQIACTRSFGHPVTAQAELAQAITEFTSRAAEKLRRQRQQASQLLTFIRTSPFRRQDEQYSRSMVWPLVRPTQDTAVLVSAALSTLQAIYRPGFNYAKAGVMLMDLTPEGLVQAELDWGEPISPVEHDDKDRSKVMCAIDSLNARYGRGTVKLASGGTEHNRRLRSGAPEAGWRMKQERRTPGYTTNWHELAVVKG